MITENDQCWKKVEGNVCKIVLMITRKLRPNLIEVLLFNLCAHYCLLPVH